ncbi:hypothetical protein DM01DRAFT_1408651 [Hesseltinella vesiculosa]|uniref:Arrestin C-terminal-like domain-containing protein n=1 Tax=Hesseltinella vesiculosa TaxID=101127 RepID=A0A1X2GE64_9FUNG|nr:hypothetical protein DM01DRAFT_1408651 [Hesseltinella vesiculosa]
MIFSLKSEKHHVKSFKLNITNGSHDKPIAFGPCSVVNGKVNLHVSKTQYVHQLKVMFECTVATKRHQKTIFSVASVLLDSQSPRSRTQGIELQAGNHMYLFAIKLPETNYPPTLHDAQYGHQVNFSLQGHLELARPGLQLHTPPVHILYLPLVTCESIAPSSPIQRQKIFQHRHNRIQIDAKLLRPACCPGDLCTIQLTTHNQSDFKIMHVELAMISSVTSQFAQQGIQRFNHTEHTQRYSIAQKHNDIYQTQLQFKIPSHCVPSAQSHQYIDIAYQLMLTIPLFASSSTNPYTSMMISLPVMIATVPSVVPAGPGPSMSSMTLLPLPRLQIPPTYQDSHGSRLATDLPSFLDQLTDSSGESPLPSPLSAFSMDGSWTDPDSHSPLLDHTDHDLMLVPPLVLPSSSPSAHLPPEPPAIVVQQDESGHLMVPTAPNPHRSRTAVLS